MGSMRNLIRDVLSTTDLPTVVGGGIEESESGQQIYDSTQKKVKADVGAESVGANNYAESVKVHESESGDINVDLSEASVHHIEAVGDLTINFTGLSEDRDGNSVLLYITDSDSNGPYSLSWNASVVWNGGIATSSVSGASDVEVNLITGDGGNQWRARKTGEDFA